MVRGRLQTGRRALACRCGPLGESSPSAASRLLAESFDPRQQHKLCFLEIVGSNSFLSDSDRNEWLLPFANP